MHKNLNHMGMVEFESILAIVKQIVAQVATAVMIALRDADVGP